MILQFLKMTMRTEKKILLDADVIIHFVKGGQFAILPSIFKAQKVILDIVTNELRKNNKFKPYIENVIATGFIKEINFKGNKQITMEYARLIKTFGKGESACMAYCRFNKDILASSNLKDIMKYCKENGILYLTTMDLLSEALIKKQLSEQECNDFIKNVKAQGSKLPVDTINEYVSKFEVRRI